MTLSQAQINSFHETVKSLTNERTVIMAIPGEIKNNGKMIPAVQVTIGHNPTQKLHKHLYRGLSSGFKPWLKKIVDKIDNR